METKINNLHLSRALQDELRRARARPAWESTNEGVHERVSFDDTLWGFQLAGGAYYNTPLRITHVKENSRASHAGIKPGDVLRCINGVDTATLTIQEAHDIIVDSGLEIKLAVSAPDVEETTHFIYQDQIAEQLRQQRQKEEAKAKKQHKKFTGAKTNDAWTEAWNCTKKRDIKYRESNCFLVPSRFESRLQNKNHESMEPKILKIETVDNST